MIKSGYWVVALTPNALDIATTIDEKRGMMYGERDGSNHLEMKEIEDAAKTMKIGVNASFKEGRSKNARNNPKIYVI